MPLAHRTTTANDPIEAANLRGLSHRILSREEELEAAQRIVDGEIELLEVLLDGGEAAPVLRRIGDELRDGTRRIDQVLRNPERGERAVLESEHLVRVFRSARTFASDARARRRLAARLGDLRLHPHVFEELESAAGAPARAEEARRRIDDAKRYLVEHNLRLVAAIAGKYKNSPLGFLDRMQEGTLGLMHAVDKFDPRLGYRLNTYASWWIKQCVERASADHGPVIRIPIHLVESRRRVTRAQRKLHSRGGVAPTARQIAELTGLPIEKVETVIDLPREPLSFETPLGATDDLRIGDLIANEATAPDVEVAARRMEERARALLESLGEREQHVLRLRFGLDGSGGQTLEEIGQSLSLTRERVRQIETAALAKLRARCAAQDYRPDF